MSFPQDRRDFLTLVGQSAGAAALLGASGASAGEQADVSPILEDVQPARIKPKKFQLALPIVNFLAFQGDYINIPIKLALGRGQPQEIALEMEVLFRSGQQGPFIAEPFSGPGGPTVSGNHTPPVRWVNGYSAGRSAGPDKLAPHIARVNHELPVTKYLRVRVSDVCRADTYALELTATSQQTRQKVKRIVKVGVHVGFDFEQPDFIVQDQQIQVQFRDLQGNPAAPETAIIRGTSPNGNCIFVLEHVGPDEGRFVAFIGNLNPSNFQWRLFAIRRGFNLFNRGVQIP